MGAVMLGSLAACGGGSQPGTNDPAVQLAGRTAARPCGPATCTLPPELEGQQPCCVNPFQGGGCGVKMAGTCRPIPQADNRCPLPMIGAMVPRGPNMMVIGCCTPSNECGFDFGLGCQALTTACNLVGPEQAKTLMPTTCDGAPIPLPADCGMNSIVPPIRRPPAAGGGG